MILNGGHVWTEPEIQQRWQERRAEWQERKRQREMQVQVEHAEHLAAKYRPTPERIQASAERMLAKYARGDFPLPYTSQCETHRAPVLDALEDLRDTERGAVR